MCPITLLELFAYLTSELLISKITPKDKITCQILLELWKIMIIKLTKKKLNKRVTLIK